MLVLNPWGRMSWKGRFSVDDHSSWTPAMKKHLSYHFFEETDNGMFWILYEDAIASFNVLEMNWNPHMLKYNKDHYG